MKDVIVCLVGPSGSGKTSVAYALQEKYGYNVIESYTTRPPRYEGEKGHIFIDFDPDKQSDFWWAGNDIIAFSKYGDYFYWATRKQYKGKGISLYVIDVSGVKKLRKTVKDAEIVVIALWAGEKERRHRMILRDYEHQQVVSDVWINEDNRERRIKYDREAFAVIPCDYVVDANPGLETVAERVNTIIRECCQTGTSMV